jgi:hypothetical protein
MGLLALNPASGKGLKERGKAWIAFFRSCLCSPNGDLRNWKSSTSRINIHLKWVTHMLSSPHNTRRWERHHVDLPVRIVPPDGLLTGAVPGRGTEISMSGMAVHSTLDLKQTWFAIVRTIVLGWSSSPNCPRAIEH